MDWVDKERSKSVGAKPRKKHREKSKRWLCTLDSMLRVHCGCGLAHFQQPADLLARGPPMSWPVLSVAPDQGSDGMCAGNYLRYHKLVNLTEMWDQSHGAWNCCKVALKACNQWTAKLLLICVNNMRHGPWSDAALHEKLVEGIDLYQACTTEDECPIFAWLLPRIVKDMDLEHRLGDASLVSEIWNGLKESRCFLTTGIHVNASRWFGANEAFRKEFDQCWHSLALGKLYVGLVTGAVTGTRFDQVVAKLKQPTEEAETIGMKQGQSELR
jgi:hypothetical protein